jgi:hypothetical protein
MNAIFAMRALLLSGSPYRKGLRAILELRVNLPRTPHVLTAMTACTAAPLV